MEFSQEICDVATSLYKENYIVSRVDIVRNILLEFESLYLEYINNNSKEKVLDICRRHSAIIEKEIYTIKDEEKELVRCLDINEEGNLIIKRNDGSIKEIISGEISIRGIKGYV